MVSVSDAFLSDFLTFASAFLLIFFGLSHWKAFPNIKSLKILMLKSWDENVQWTSTGCFTLKNRNEGNGVIDRNYNFWFS